MKSIIKNKKNKFFNKKIINELFEYANTKLDAMQSINNKI